MKRGGLYRKVASTTVLIALVASGCGGGSKGSSVEAVSSQVADICRTVGRGISSLDPAQSLTDVRSNANDASALYEDAVNSLKKLKLPTSDKSFDSDLQDLISSYEDQLDTLDAIAKAARENDQPTVDTKIEELNKQASDSNDLADSLSISRCQLDPVFESTTTTSTTTTTTSTTTTTTVPLTLPIATEPPPDTTPVTTPSNKTIISSSDLVPLGSYTFADAPDTAMNGFITLLNLSPTVAAQSGQIIGVDVIFDSSSSDLNRLFAFQSDTNPLPAGSFDEVSPYLTSGASTTPKTVGTINGIFWTDPDGTVNFAAAEQNVIVWAFAPNEGQLDQTLQAWGESISQ